MSSRGWATESVRLNHKYYPHHEYVGQQLSFKDMIAKHLHPTSVVLDVGAGAGRGYSFNFKVKFVAS